MRYFNTSGQCLPGVHYMLPAEERLPEARPLIERGSFFVLHAPRQTGKTTTLATLARELTAEGRYAALRFSCEVGRAVSDDYEAATRGILSEIRSSAKYGLDPELRPPDWPDAPAASLLKDALTAWAEQCPRPLVLFFDEIDALVGQSLITVLSQLRAGYTDRPSPFPHSVVLCGLRDVRDYRVAAGQDPTRLGTSSPFNVKVTSLRLGDFTQQEIKTLYGQHTADTGQPFTDEAVQRAYDYTQGQPWLVNALAAEILDQMRIPLSTPITPEHVDEAKERLIVARATHLDSLTARLAEPRVRRVIEPLMAGEFPPGDFSYNDDLSYLQDLGLVAQGKELRIANPIYQEVILRVLAQYTENAAASVAPDPRSFVLPDGRLDFGRLLDEFAEFWREHGEILSSEVAYHEVAPQLVLMGFLHRVINGGGQIHREVGVGTGRIDLLIRWPYKDDNGKRAVQKEAIELKVWHPAQKDPLPKALGQLDRYLERFGLNNGTLIIFDRRHNAPPFTERISFTPTNTPSGRDVILLRA